MTKYLNIVLFLFCVGILCTTRCSKVPEEHKSESNRSAKTSLSDTMNTHRSKATKAEKSPGDVNQTEMAIERAGKENKYLYLVFYKQGDQKSKEMKQVVTQVQEELSPKANFVNIDVEDENEQGIIRKYGIDGGAIPITLIMAPNGVIVGGFPNEVTVDKLRNAFVSPKMAEIVKAIQSRELVFLLVTNNKMKYYKENIAVAKQVAANELQGYAQVIVVDPRDERETSLLKQCRIDKSVNETMFVFINGGRIMCTSSGRLTRDGLLEEIKTGCSPSGCK